MKALYFDCFSGISGDMTLGALLDLGLDINVFLDELKKLNLDEYEFKIKESFKNGIKGTDVNIIVYSEVGEDCKASEIKPQCEEVWHDCEHIDAAHNNHSYNDNHHHVDAHIDQQSNLHTQPDILNNVHTHKHHHMHSDVENNGHEHGRNMADIRCIIENSSLNVKVKDLSLKVFEEIAAAEAKVHGKEIDEVHFHEVGAVDSIVDIVGTAICLDMLGVEKVYSSALHEGTGFIKCRHGIIPVPVPAVMEMLAGSDIPVVTEDIATELVTPTGMGIIKCISSGFGVMPKMKVKKVGYGMGKKDTGKFNALRVLFGEVDDTSSSREISVLETNIDDMTSEILGYIMDKLMSNGALDVFYTPIYMKKNRPAYMMTVLADKDHEQRLVDIILRETSTLGIRKTYAERYVMNREVVTVDTSYGKIRVKKAQLGNIMKFAPEYEDCRKIAEDTEIPLKDVYEAVVKAARDI